MEDLIEYLNTKISDNDRYIVDENMRERGIRYDRIKGLEAENKRLRQWVSDIRALCVTSAGEVYEGNVFKNGVTCGG